MGVQTKIYTNILVWAAVTLAFFLYGLPKIQSSLIHLQQSHSAQITQYNTLKAEVKGLNDIQGDLNGLAQQPIKPTDLFGYDVDLVKNVQSIESMAKAAGGTETTMLSGTADSATPVQSAAGLNKIVYSIKLVGDFNATIQFMRYLENAYFISPIDGVDIQTADSTGASVTANFVTHFLIRK